MLLNVLTSSYLQYKADTDTVASWLASTAKKCGYAPDLLEKEKVGQNQPSKRLKGKARKQAREAAKCAQEESELEPGKPAPGPTYIIAIKDFTGLAEYIASFTRPPVRVPKPIVAAIDRAISLRRDHADHPSFQLSQVAKDLAANESHSYFIGVLERVREIL
jgi:hypothetical protein